MYLFSCVWKFCLHVCMSVCHRMPEETRRGHQLLRDGVTDGCELPCVFWKPSLSLWKSSLTSPSLQPPYHCVNGSSPGSRGAEECWPPCSALSFAIGLPLCFRVTTVVSLGGTFGLMPQGAAYAEHGARSKGGGVSKGKISQGKKMSELRPLADLFPLFLIPQMGWYLRDHIGETPSIWKVSKPFTRAKTQTLRRRARLRMHCVVRMCNMLSLENKTAGALVRY